MIGFGIIDSRYQNERYCDPFDQSKANLVRYDGDNGVIYGEGRGRIKQEGGKIKDGDIV